MKIYDNQLFENYSLFQQKKITKRRFKYAEFTGLINSLSENKELDISVVGKSFEERDIFQIKIGNGSKQILLWSQMHGNEPTGTLAIFDIINFFIQNVQFNDIKDRILENCTLIFIPLLNPDGAELFQRRNAQGIDLNRDASKLIAPESRILLKIRDKKKPDFGFNLHDQDLYYGVENTQNPTAMAFLAPAYDFEKNINKSRTEAMKIIASMNNMLQNFISNRIAKYSDSYMPNAFGDNIQKKGTSTILIESGYYPNDPERQFIRKLNFTAILHALNSIATNSHKNINLNDYFSIPPHKKDTFYDYIIRNVTIQKSNNKKFTTDIAISYDKSNREVFTDYLTEYFIQDIGDLSQKSGFKEYDLNGKTIDDKNNRIKKLERAEWLLKITC